MRPELGLWNQADGVRPPTHGFGRGPRPLLTWKEGVMTTVPPSLLGGGEGSGSPGTAPGKQQVFSERSCVLSDDLHSLLLLTYNHTLQR